MKVYTCIILAITLVLVVFSVAQDSTPKTQTATADVVPRLIKFSGTTKDETGNPISGILGVTFALYKDELGGSPLWLETQNVQPDANGHYTVMLGATKPDGLPLDLFTSGEARWLGARTGQQEQPRILLVSVPYAIKAHEAETFAGRNISDFVLNETQNSVSRRASYPSASSAGHSSTSSSTPPPPAGPTTFTGSNSTQIVGVTQTGSGTGLSATAGTHAAVAGTITGPSNTAVYGLASNTTAGSNAAGVTGQANTQTGPGVQGVTTSSKGFGVQGVVTSTSGGTAVQGLNKATSGYAIGVAGQTSSVTSNSAGVTGFEAATTGHVFGVIGSTNTTTNFAAGVSGFEGAATGQVFGVAGGTNSVTNFSAGISGFEGAATGSVFGVQGGTSSTTNGAAGVNGFEGAKTGVVFGVFGSTNSTTTNAQGVSGFEGAATGQVYGVNGSSNSTGPFAAGVNGFEGATTGQVFGVSGSTNSTTNFAAGVSGFEGATTGIVFGVQGGINSTTNGATGVSGSANATTGATTGVAGSTNSSTAGANGVFGGANATTGVTFGVQGVSNSSSGVGVQGSSPNNAIAGFNQTCNSSGCTIHPGTAGRFVTATGGTLLQGLSGSTLSSLTQVFTVDAAGDGFYAGNLNVKGTVSKGGGSFKIDHPLDPAHKFLSHSFVESPDMMNVYNGNIRTDKRGMATVVLPDYFEALNRDFRYQLTVIGQFAQAIVAKKIVNNRFVIRTNKPHVEVSWQITGIRHDAYANAYRIPTEEVKPPQEQGQYLHPELFGASDEQAVANTAVVPSITRGSK
jgi:trimeric autotransporter adhesin